MPAISRVRLTNIKYNKQLKVYDNLIFDLKTENKPLHSLISFVNSGGKGVLLQSLFQVLLPETPWGSSNENRVKHFFYNEKGQPAPYTMYIAIEWHLDDRADNALITGIAISGEDFKNDITQMDINYSLFTYVTTPSSPYQLGKLPYYNEETDHVWSLSEWDAFLDSHKSFRKFSKSTKSKYYTHLKEDFGIYKEDWLAMKEMNRKEAGITDYFEKGNNTTTNYGLFYHLIIPAIIENIQSSIDIQEQKDLITLFKEMALIAKNLPILNQREVAYRDISEMNAIISYALQDVQRIKEKLDASVYDGNVLQLLLNNELNQMESDLHDWKEEQKRLIESEKDYQWQSINLKYNREYFKGKELEKEIEDIETIQTESIEIKEQIEGELLNTEVNLLLKDYKQKIDDRDVTLNLIKQIESQSDFQDITAKLNELSNAITKEWESVYPSVNDRLYLFNQKIEGLSKNENEISIEVERWRNSQSDSKAKNSNINERLTKHNEDLEKIRDQFVEYPQLEKKPKEVLNLHVDLLNELEEELEQIEKEITFNRVEEDDLLVKSTRLSSTIEGLQNNYKEAQTKHEVYISEEKKVIESVFRLSGSESDFNPTLKWVEQQKEKLTKQLKRLEDTTIPLLQQQFWKLQSESYYAKSDFWIPNHELVELKQLIEEKGIQILFGTDYLSSHDEANRIDLNNRFPLLKYGLMVYEGDMEKIQAAIDLSEKTLYAPVPIYVVNRLDKEEVCHYTLLNDQSTILATNPKEWEIRREKLSDEIEQYRLNIQSQKEKKDTILKVLNQIEQTLKYTSFDIKKEMDAIEYEINLKQEESKDVKRNREKLEDIQRQLNEKKKKVSDKLDSTEDKVKTLENWLDKVAQNKVDLENFSVYEQQFREAEYHLNVTTNKYNKIKEQKEAWNVTLKTWKNQLVEKMAKFKTFNLNVVKPTGVERLLGEDTQEPTEDFAMFSQVERLYTDWNNHQSEAQTLNTELARLKERIKYENASIQEVEDKLRQLDSEWKQREIPTKPKGLLVQEKTSLINAKKEIEGKINELEKTVLVSSTNLRNVDKSKADIKEEMNRSEVQKPIELWEDMDLVQKETDIINALVTLKKDIKETGQAILQLDRKQQDYRSNEKRLSDNLYQSVKVSHIPKRLEHQLAESVSNAIDKWVQEFKDSSSNFRKFMENLSSTFQEQKSQMEQREWDIDLKEDMLSTYNNINVLDLDEIEGVIKNVNDFILNERDIMRAERDKGEKAKEDWVYNASEMVLTIVEALKRMKSSMTIVNKGNYKFPIIDFADYKLPKNLEDVQEPLKEFFEKKIKEVINDYKDIEQVKLSDLKKIIDNSKITLAALGQFPVLKIYNLNTDNTFMYDIKKAEYYTEWETINNSSETQAAGSGGQKVAARTLIAMMLLNYKRQHHMKGKWNVMISDNPFANAVSVHVVDPIIAVADALKIQWIVVAPPETIKAEVSVKFPVYYPLSFKRSPKGKDIVIQEVQQNIRKYTEQTTLF